MHNGQKNLKSYLQSSLINVAVDKTSKSFNREKKRKKALKAVNTFYASKAIKSTHWDKKLENAYS